MMFCDFQTRTFAKWILAGEHAVTRGKSALVFPLKSYALTLTYKNTPSLQITSMDNPGMESFFLKLLELACMHAGKDYTQIHGHFHFDSSLPKGSGMGSSAALCVALARWFIAQGWLDSTLLYEFSKTLENHFHGKSSGVDIVGVSAENGVLFENGICQPINQCWEPFWYLSFCGLGSTTAECVRQVQELGKTNQTLASQLDDLMGRSVLDAKSALESKDANRTDKLAKAIHQAADCFRQWGLIEGRLKAHMEDLSSKGAIAVKPTGSGSGGYVLSLWDAPLNTTEGFIPLKTLGCQ